MKDFMNHQLNIILIASSILFFQITKSAEFLPQNAKKPKMVLGNWKNQTEEDTRFYTNSSNEQIGLATIMAGAQSYINQELIYWQYKDNVWNCLIGADMPIPNPFRRLVVIIKFNSVTKIISIERYPRTQLEQPWELDLSKEDIANLTVVIDGLLDGALFENSRVSIRNM